MDDNALSDQLMKPPRVFTCIFYGTNKGLEHKQGCVSRCSITHSNGCPIIITTVIMSNVSWWQHQSGCV